MWRWSARWIVAGSLMAAGERVTLPIVVFDHSHVPSGILTAAETHFGNVLALVGIDVQWVHPNPGDHQIRAGGSVLVMYLVQRRQMRHVKTGTLGCLGLAAVRSVQAQPVYSVVIFYDQLKPLAQGRHDLSLILGHVMLHETGHILLGPAHSLAGIMTPGWSAEVLSRIEKGVVVFTREESSRMQATLQARHKMRETAHSCERRLQ
jgi:hypothetical protein